MAGERAQRCGLDTLISCSISPSKDSASDVDADAIGDGSEARRIKSGASSGFKWTKRWTDY